MSSDLPLVLTVEEAADCLRISRGSAYEGIRTGEIPHVRIGRTIRVPRHLLLTFLGAALLTEDPPEAIAHARRHPGGALRTQEVQRDNDGRAKAGRK